jgi:long-chain acyl-CoA synthetase
VNLADIFAGLAGRWPERRAVVSQHLALTYAQLLARAAQTARELQARGIGTGARIGISLRDSAESVASMLAIWMLGATAVPMDFRTPLAERNRLAGEFALDAIIEDRQAPAAGFQSIFAGPSWCDVIARHATTPLWSNGEERAPAMISLTSGTTGQPVGFVLDHERVLFRSLFEPFHLIGFALLNTLPLSFSASRTYTLGALLQGATVHFHPILSSPEALREAILHTKVTSVTAVPTTIRNLLELAGERTSPLFEDLRAFFAVGAPVPTAEKLMAMKFLCGNFVDGYGASVCGSISALYGSDLEANPDSVGRILAHVAVQIVDPQDEVLPPGQSGIIRVRSPGSASGIVGAMRGSGDTIKQGWAYPGDIGVIDNSGILRLLGRTTDLIIRGGANVHPAEVEAVIAEHEGVREVAVVGFTHAREGEEIAAFVVPAGDLTESALMAHCRNRLAPDKRPRRYVFLPELPRNANGKIIRTLLRQEAEKAV